MLQWKKGARNALNLLPKQKGASLSPGDLVEFTPLHYAAWFAREQIVQVGLGGWQILTCIYVSLNGSVSR